MSMASDYAEYKRKAGISDVKPYKANADKTGGIQATSPVSMTITPNNGRNAFQGANARAQAGYSSRPGNMAFPWFNSQRGGNVPDWLQSIPQFDPATGLQIDRTSANNAQASGNDAWRSLFGLKQGVTYDTGSFTPSQANQTGGINEFYRVKPYQGEQMPQYDQGRTYLNEDRQAQNVLGQQAAYKKKYPYGNIFAPMNVGDYLSTGANPEPIRATNTITNTLQSGIPPYVLPASQPQIPNYPGTGPTPNPNADWWKLRGNTATPWQDTPVDPYGDGGYPPRGGYGGGGYGGYTPQNEPWYINPQQWRI